jgi:hypothetical protein
MLFISFLVRLHECDSCEGVVAAEAMIAAAVAAVIVRRNRRLDESSAFRATLERVGVADDL